MERLKPVALWVMIVFYIVAGINHFVHPQFYYAIIPPYLPWPDPINSISGVIEIVLGALLIFTFTRKLAAYGIITMLIAFIPAHIYFIQMNSCVPDTWCTGQVIGWVRLVVIHPLLILWAHWIRK